MFSGSVAIASLRRHERRFGMRVCRIVVNPALDLGPEVPGQPLDRPGGGVAEGADGAALDLARDLDAVDDELGHRRQPSTILWMRSASCCTDSFGGLPLSWTMPFRAFGSIVMVPASSYACMIFLFAALARRAA